MKIGKILYISAMILGAGLLAAGCSKSEIDPSAANGYITFDLGISGATRADDKKDGEDSHNENTFKTLDVFFYDENATDDTPALLHVNQSAEKVGTGYQVKIAVNNLTNPASGTGLTADTNYKVYAVANCAETEKLTDLPSLNTLKAVTTSTNEFRSDKAPNSFVMTNFGQSEILTFSESEDKTYTLTFKRVAAKIRVAISVEEELTDEDGKTWTPDLDAMRLFISNGVRTARLDGDVSKLELKGDPDPTDPSHDNSGDYYHILTQGSTETDDYTFARLFSSPANRLEEIDADYPYYNDLPLYTYPNEWSDGVTESYQTMLTIVVPWENKSTDSDGDGDDDATTTYRPTYYRVPVTSGGEIVSNAYYYLRAHIGMLGSVTPEKPMVVDVECEIAPWVDADATVADIRPVRYLIFSQKEFNMNNTEKIIIPFVSTHNCNIVKVEYKYYSYYNNGGQKDTHTVTVNNNPVTKNPLKDTNTTRVNGVNTSRTFTATINNTDKTLTFENDFTSRGDYSQYDVDIVVRHENEGDNTAYQETITLHVYPPAYIQTDYVSRDDYSGNRGYVIVNGNSSSSTSPFGGIKTGTDSDGNSDDMRCLTTITITQLNEEEKAEWVIKDPRRYYINNNLDDDSMLTDTADQLDIWSPDSPVSAPTFWATYDNTLPVGDYWDPKNDKNNRTLKYYYPCGETDDYIDFISPRFIVASYHGRHGGVTNPISKSDARRRCASYQQYGYPAGRWRLMTFAEMNYIKSLQTKSIIVDIFYNQSNSATEGNLTTWCAQGVTNARGLTGKDKDAKSYTRCVYDLWYWEKVDANGKVTLPANLPSEKYDTFTWGDRPKENPLDDVEAETDNNTRAATRRGYTVQDYLQEHSAGNYAVIRDGENVRLEKMDDNE